MSARRLELLLVEDDPGDVLLIREAFDSHGTLGDQLHHVSDGTEALAFLRREEPYAGVPTPDLILLDLNLPRMDGREVLARVKSDADLRHIPIIVLTTSDAEEDILRSYDLHANAYVTKPVDFDRFVEVVRKVEDFFVTVAKLPASNAAGRG